jgi:FecR-like protein
MTASSRETERIMDRFLKELGEPVPSTVRMRRATQRVLENLSGFDDLAAPTAEVAALPASRPKRRWTPVAAVAAALLAAAILVGTLSLPSSAQPIARRLNGKLISAGDSNAIAEGKLIQTGGDGGEILALRDGSRVEMNDSVKLSINRATDGIQVDLNEGNIIVTAVKQHNGHLYVKTRDCVVSVVGTVFSVKAEAAGSRVAVIEGEVHVQHGDILQTLLPGQQVATNVEMKAVPIQSEIGWSQDAAAHVAMLQQATVPSAPATPPAANAGTITQNPDILGEIRAILAPVDEGDAAEKVVKNKATFFEIFQAAQNSPFPAEEARGGIVRSFQNWAVPPNGFSFAITGIQGRTISFSNSRNETFSYGCADCSFLVSENGISTAVSSTVPGVEFKLSPDGNTLSATCHAAPCSMGRWFRNFSWTVKGAAVNRWSSGVIYGVSPPNSATPQSFAIPTAQLTSQQNPSVLFVVTKP